MELLAVMCEHLYELAAEWRGVIALELYKVYIFPLLQTILSMEEESSSNGASVLLLPGATSTSFTNGANTNMNLRHQILNIMSDANLLKSFVLLAIEVLNYTLEVVPQQGSKYEGEIMDMSSLPWQEMISMMGLDGNGTDGLGNTGPTAADFRDSMDSLQMMEKMNILPRMNSIGSTSSGGEVVNNAANNSQMTWPWLIDKKLVDMFINFFKPHFAFDDNENRSRDSLVISHSASREMILYHMTILYVMQLRFQCGLRGVKPSQLLGSSPLRDIVSGTVYGMQSDIIAEDIDANWRKVKADVTIFIV